MVVMAIIAIIIAAMVKVAGHVYENAKIRNTKNTIQLLVSAMKEYENFYSQGNPNFLFPSNYPTGSTPSDVNDSTIWDDYTELTAVQLNDRLLAQSNIEILYANLDDVPDCQTILNRIPSDVTANDDNDSVTINGQPKGLIEVNDAWGHPISYQTQGVGNFPLLRSAGPDGIFGNADDILSSEM
jgi:type II secretory pathway pseudopilin PulG